MLIDYDRSATGFGLAAAKCDGNSDLKLDVSDFYRYHTKSVVLSQFRACSLTMPFENNLNAAPSEFSILERRGFAILG